MFFSAGHRLVINCLQVTSQMWSGTGRSYRLMISLHFLSSRKACSKQLRIPCQLISQVWSVSSTIHMHEHVRRVLQAQQEASGWFSCRMALKQQCAIGSIRSSRQLSSSANKSKVQCRHSRVKYIMKHCNCRTLLLISSSNSDLHLICAHHISTDIVPIPVFVFPA